jgi:hypothetical protein
MKVTITLTDKEVNAVKAYLTSVSPDINPKITKRDIEQEIAGIVTSAMQQGALGDYYSEYVLNQ